MTAVPSISSRPNTVCMREWLLLYLCLKTAVAKFPKRHTAPMISSAKSEMRHKQRELCTAPLLRKRRKACLQILRQRDGRMKILILFGSPKTNGSTAKLTGAFMKGIRKSDDVEIVHLFHCNRLRAMLADIVRRQTVALKKTLKSLWQSSKTPMR